MQATIFGLYLPALTITPTALRVIANSTTQTATKPNKKITTILWPPDLPQGPTKCTIILSATQSSYANDSCTRITNTSRPWFQRKWYRVVFRYTEYSKSITSTMDPKPKRCNGRVTHHNWKRPLNQVKVALSTPCHNTRKKNYSAIYTDMKSRLSIGKLLKRTYARTEKTLPGHISLHGTSDREYRTWRTTCPRRYVQHFACRRSNQHLPRSRSGFLSYFLM